VTAEEKLAALQELLRSLGTVGVAYSGGTDSSFLLKVAHDALGEAAIGLMAVSPSFPAWEREEAVSLAMSIGARVVLVPTDELGEERFASNPDDRCYHCKRHILGRIMEAASREGVRHLVDGINADDAETHRHGLRAARELGARSPLAEVDLDKKEVRYLARGLGLASADKPHSACLASRLPFGERITAEKLDQVESAERALRHLGLGQLRVRHHGETARIEVLPEDFHKVLSARERVVADLQAIGFRFVCLDLQGFRSGSLERNKL